MATERRRPRASPFLLSLSLCTLLLTAVVARGIWDSYYPDRGREGLRQRKAYYEKVLKGADLSWREALYYKVVETGEER